MGEGRCPEHHREPDFKKSRGGYCHRKPKTRCAKWTGYVAEVSWKGAQAYMNSWDFCTVPGHDSRKACKPTRKRGDGGRCQKWSAKSIDFRVAAAVLLAAHSLSVASPRRSRKLKQLLNARRWASAVVPGVVKKIKPVVEQ